MTELNVNKIRHQVKDLYAEYWTATDLYDFWEANDHDENAVIAECMEDLAANPDKATRWGREGTYTYDDRVKIAESGKKSQRRIMDNPQNYGVAFGLINYRDCMDDRK